MWLKHLQQTQVPVGVQKNITYLLLIGYILIWIPKGKSFVLQKTYSE